MIYHVDPKLLVELKMVKMRRAAHRYEGLRFNRPASAQPPHQWVFGRRSFGPSVGEPGRGESARARESALVAFVVL